MSNLALVRRFTLDFLGCADLAAADATLDPDVRAITGLKPDGPIEGREAYKATISGFVAAFPAESPVEIIDQFEAGDRVVTRFHSRQRHSGDFFGVPATNQVILFDETHVSRIRDGRIVENIVSATNLEFEMLMAPALTPLILPWLTRG